MRYSIRDHLGEAVPFMKALDAAGHERTVNGPADLFLVDLDPDMFGYREAIDFYRDCGAVVIQYPHGAPCSTLAYDCIYDPYPGVDGELTNGQGEIDYLRSIGVERPARIMGWQLCHQFEFRPTDKPKRIVFAPTHVNGGNGKLDPIRVESNANVFRQLLEGDWELVVRFLGDYEECGLWSDERVFRYVSGAFEITTVEMDVADCVVAAWGTYPCLSIARGIPTIMYDQLQPVMYGIEDEERKPLRNLDRYRDLLRYPLNFEDGPLNDTILAACSSDESIADWRDAWIGKPFDPEAFVNLLEEWVPELRERRESCVALPS